VGFGAVLGLDSFVDFCHYVNRLLAYLTSYLFPFFLTYLLCYLSICSRIGPFHFQARVRKRRRNLALVFVFILCCSIFCYGCMFAFVVFGLVCLVLVRRLAGKNVSEILCRVGHTKCLQCFDAVGWAAGRASGL